MGILWLIAKSAPVSEPLGWNLVAPDLRRISSTSLLEVWRSESIYPFLDKSFCHHVWCNDKKPQSSEAALAQNHFVFPSWWRGLGDKWTYCPSLYSPNYSPVHPAVESKSIRDITEPYPRRNNFLLLYTVLFQNSVEAHTEGMIGACSLRGSLQNREAGGRTPAYNRA